MIKFRGKLKESENWVYGHYYEVPAPLSPFEPMGEPECNIVFLDPDAVSDWNMPRKMVRGIVRKDTVGQFTGKKDIDGKEIYKDDILECKLSSGKTEYYYIIYNQEECAFECINKDNTNFMSPSIWDTFKVIGNIHDNKDLLEKIL